VQRLFSSLSPYWRGSLYYTAFWSTVGVFAPFVNLRWLEIGVTQGQIGFLSAFGPLMAMLLAPFVSRLADQRALHQPLLAVALSSTGLAFFLLGFAQNFTGVLIGSLATAVTGCAFGPLADGLIARMASHYRLEFGRMRRWGSLAFAAASLLFGFVWAGLGYGIMLFLAGALLILFTPVAFALKLEGNQVFVEESIPARGIQPPGVWTPALLVLLGVNLLMGFALGFVGPFLGVRMQNLGGGAIAVGAFFALSALCEFPAMRFERRVAAQIGDAGVLVISSALFAVTYLGYALAPNAGVMLGFAVLQGAAFGLFFVASVRTIDARAGALLGTLQSWRNALIAGVSPLIAGPVGGLVAQGIGVNWVFVLAAVFAACSAVLVWVTRRQLEPGAESNL
jgi:MFS transporter, PPP family, 3-phenylpropionic acid transporter